MNHVYPIYFEAFKPRGGFNPKLTGINLIICCLLLFLAVQYLKESIPNPMIIDTITLMIGLGFLGVLIYRVFFEIEKPNHKSVGLICFLEDSIKLISEQKTFSYEDITEFKIGRIREAKLPIRDLIYPCYSAGQDTFLILSSNKKNLKIHLRLNNDDDKQAFETIARDQFASGRIKLNTVYYGLDLNYEEVQKLKGTAQKNG